MHEFFCIAYADKPQSWRGFEPLMQLHEKRHIKRAGVAGRALRAGRDIYFNFMTPQRLVVALMSHDVSNEMY